MVRRISGSGGEGDWVGGAVGIAGMHGRGDMRRGRVFLGFV